MDWLKAAQQLRDEGQPGVLVTVAEFGPAGWSVDLGCPSTPEAVYWAVQAARDAAGVEQPAPAYAGV